MSIFTQRIEELLSRRVVDDDALRALGGRAAGAWIALLEAGGGRPEAAPEDRAWRCQQAVRALGLLGTGRAADYLVALARDPERAPALRGAAVRSLGDSGDRRAIAALAELAADADFVTRKNAVLGLGRSSRRDARQALRAVADNDPDPAVREYAAVALGDIEQPGPSLHEKS